MTTDTIPASATALPPFTDDALCVELRRARALLTAADTRFWEIPVPGMDARRLKHFCETEAMVAAAGVLLDATLAKIEGRL